MSSLMQVNRDRCEACDFVTDAASAERHDPADARFCPLRPAGGKRNRPRSERAQNLLADMGRVSGVYHYDGYGSCPLTVERGRIVLAEFGYGGKLLPSFPSWLIDGKRPSRMAWLLKEKVLPPVYWGAMLKGREWMLKHDRVKPESLG